MGSLAHILKCSLGTGILAIPLAFKNSGLLFGAIGTLIVGLICTHCVQILVSINRATTTTDNKLDKYFSCLIFLPSEWRLKHHMEYVEGPKCLRSILPAPPKLSSKLARLACENTRISRGKLVRSSKSIVQPKKSIKNIYFVKSIIRLDLIRSSCCWHFPGHFVNTGCQPPI